MTDNLRSKVIRLAHQNPELRADLLPLLAHTAAQPKAVNSDLADNEAEKSLRRSGELDKTLKDMSALISKVGSAKPGAFQRFDKLYLKLAELGSEANNAARILVDKYFGAYPKSDKSEQAFQFQSSIRILHKASKDWELNELAHFGKPFYLQEIAVRQKFHQAGQTQAYAKVLEVRIRTISEVLKGKYVTSP